MSGSVAALIVAVEKDSEQVQVDESQVELVIATMATDPILVLVWSWTQYLWPKQEARVIQMWLEKIKAKGIFFCDKCLSENTKQLFFIWFMNYAKCWDPGKERFFLTHTLKQANNCPLNIWGNI